MEGINGKLKGAAMSELIKCPICHKMAGIRYSENRVYQSQCQNIKCRETVTVTASSEAAAEELFSKFEKGTNQPQLTIPQSIADALDVGDLMFLAWTHGNDLLGKVSDEERNAECRRRNAIAKAYLAGKALGVDLVKVVADD